MRSKEVENSMERLKNGKHHACFGNTTAIYFIKDVDTVLNHISELEEDNINWKGKYHLLSRKIDVTPNSVIRDKIKELEDNTCIYCGGECVKIDGDYWEVGGIFKVLKSNLSVPAPQDVDGIAAVNKYGVPPFACLLFISAFKSFANLFMFSGITL